mgnify:FL=1|tara:strand:- start:95 stop:325 length:231 start_codon:yes stop_codon:yes gene_type:complete
MTEFTTGIHNACMTILKSSSFTLALIYTFGHIVISMTVIYFMTGATLFEAGIVALIEPAINGVWFYILHSLWRKLK